MSAQRRLSEPAHPAPTSPDPAHVATGEAPGPSPARALQARLESAYAAAPGFKGELENLPPLVRLAIVVGSASGVWVFLGGLAFVILR